ncbi:hypothetical protein GEMRC1_007200 [Eukaryota sp. GEM-RC1]
MSFSINLPSLNLSNIRSGTFKYPSTTLDTNRTARMPITSRRVPHTTREPALHPSTSRRRPYGNPRVPTTSRPLRSRPTTRAPEINLTDFPLSATDTLKKYRAQLTPYEESEILEFQTIYFISPLSIKTRALRSHSRTGHDDERGDYLPVLHDHLSYRYEILGSLGKGSFGQVLKCKDHKTGVVVAVKIIRNKRRFHQQGLVEVKILKFLRDHDPEGTMNFVRVFDNFYFRNHLCISFELLSLNLYEYLKRILLPHC